MQNEAGEVYMAATGRSFTVLRAQAFGETFWTYRDERGWGRDLSRASNRHATREAAIERLEQEERIGAATDVPDQLSRGAYEAACAAANQEPLDDGEINRMAYGLVYGEFALPEYEPEHIIRMKLARRRLAAMESEQRLPPAPVADEEIRCPSCGRPTRRPMLMSASFGPACPECYDETSERA
ncbi:MAG: hypothetical protein ACM3ZA_14875 [Bacillota bacterium]